MKSQHVVWIGVLCSSTLVGAFLGNAILQRRASQEESAGPVLAGRDAIAMSPSSVPELLSPPQRPSPKRRVRVAELEETDLDEGDIPSVLPDAEDAAPIDQRRENAAREIVERELPNATQAERDIWLEELKGLPPNVMEDVLRIRRGMGRVVRDPVLVPQIDLPETTPDVDVAESPAIPWPDEPTDPAFQTALVAVDQAIAVVRHNIANASTPGFRRLRPQLVDRDYVAVGESEVADPDVFEPPVPNRVFVGSGSRLEATLVDDTPGEHVATNRDWDVAIVGSGWFQVRRGRSDIVYTRRGMLTRDSDGTLAVRIGVKTLPLEPVIEVPASADIQVADDGAVSVAGSDSEVLGKIEVVDLVAEDLRPIGNGLYELGGTAGLPVSATGTLRQGSLERSNVDLEQELDELRRLLVHRRALGEFSGKTSTSAPSGVDANGD